MSENLDNFLVDLASDPDRRAAFFANPAGEADEAMLTADEKAAVLTGDGSRVRRALGLASRTAIPQTTFKKPAKKGGAKKKGGRKKPASKKK